MYQFKMHSLTSFDQRICPTNYRTSQEKYFLSPENLPCALCSQPPQFPRSLGKHWSLNGQGSGPVAFSRMSYKWNYKLCTLLCLASFAQHSIFETLCCMLRRMDWKVAQHDSCFPCSCTYMSPSSKYGQDLWLVPRILKGNGLSLSW